LMTISDTMKPLKYSEVFLKTETSDSYKTLITQCDNLEHRGLNSSGLARPASTGSHLVLHDLLDQQALVAT
jgi:hypothetical protein